MHALMSPVRLIAGGLVATAASLLTAAPASAQAMCDDAALVNPIVVTGTTSFEPTLRQLALRLAAETAPRTIIYAIDSASSCGGIANVADAMDLGGKTGLHYTKSGATYVRDACTFAPGQKAHAAISDVFYESCTNLPQPRPAELMDVVGPVQTTVFVVPSTDLTTQAITYEEARAIYGCGVSTARPVAGISDPMASFCWNGDAGPPMVVAGTLGLPSSQMTPPKCSFGGGTVSAVTQNLLSYSSGGIHTIGFVTADVFDDVRASVNALAFRAQGQTSAFNPDSASTFPDRRNVRDGHYTLWGYEHVFAKTTGANLSPQAAELVGWLTGTKLSASIDYVALEGSAGLIPQCAMRVRRSSDGGLLSPYTPPESCHCAFTAAITRTLPPDCVACTGNAMCTGGKVCRRGFCE